MLARKVLAEAVPAIYALGEMDPDSFRIMNAYIAFICKKAVAGQLNNAHDMHMAIQEWIDYLLASDEI